MDNAKIMIVDDNKNTRDFITKFLSHKGYKVFQACDGQDALEKIELTNPCLIVTDLMMPRVNGLEFIRRLKAMRPELVVIAYSAFANFEMTSDLLKAGAFFYMDKPFELEDFAAHIKRGLEHYALQSRTFTAAPRIRNRSHFQDMIGESGKMLAVFELIEKVADSESTVLIQGESGTGKELVARAIHDLSDRRSKSFVPINSAAIPDELLESELFGHLKGSFTGAVATRVGRFEMADGGSLFLDEIGEMKLRLQAKLLRVLQSRELEPIGAHRAKKVDVRVIAATNQNLERLVAAKEFRDDLYYRLSVIPIVIPPLRDRKEDIPLFLNSFLEKYCKKNKRKIKGVDNGALDMLCNGDWPGNVRELENLVEYLVIVKGSGTITVDDLPEKYRGVRKVLSREDLSLPDSGFCLSSALTEFENRLILQALEKTGGNKKEAAILLNLKRTTLLEKLKKKNLNFTKTIQFN